MYIYFLKKKKREKNISFHLVFSLQISAAARFIEKGDAVLLMQGERVAEASLS